MTRDMSITTLQIVFFAFRLGIFLAIILLEKTNIAKNKNI